MDKDTIVFIGLIGGLVLSFGSLVVMDRLFKWPLGSKR